MAQPPDGWTLVTKDATGWTPVDKTETPSDGSPSSKGALVMQGVAKSGGPLAKAATEIATNPSLPRTTASAARVVGGLAPIVANPTNPMSYIAAPGSAWAAGKGGWFGGKMLQSASAPIANILTKVAPFAQTLSTLSGAQGILDLAQIAEPQRKDIGVLGVGSESRSLEDKKAHPALLNMLASKVSEAIASLTDLGMSKRDAAKAIADSIKP